MPGSRLRIGLQTLLQTCAILAVAPQAAPCAFLTPCLERPIAPYWPQGARVSGVRESSVRELLKFRTRSKKQSFPGNNRHRP